jgi:dGTPase
LLHFEGNAQGLRTVLRLQHPDQPAGLQLTMPTLGAFVKYPCDAVHGLREAQGVGLHKFGFMDSERPWFRELASQLGLKPREAGEPDASGRGAESAAPAEPSAWHRHPLAFLVEAADDICYGVIDIEDGVKSGHIAFDELEALHAPFIDAPHCERARALGDRQHRAEYLRAVTIGVLVERAARVFHDRHDDLLAGRFDEPLLDGIEGAAAFQRFRQLAAERLYEERSKLAWQVAGFEIIGWLLRNFCEAVERMAEAGSPTERARMLVRVMPGGAQAAALPQRYLRLLRVTDFVAGMTDRYAVDTCLRLRGLGADR